MEEKIRQIKDLIKNKEYQTAYKICLECISADPDNSTPVRLKNKIETLVEEQNIKLIDNDIRKLDPLWDEKKYGEIIERLQKLYTFAPHYIRIYDLLKKAKKLSEKQQIKNTNEYIDRVIDEMYRLVSEKKFSEAISREEDIKRFTNFRPDIKKVFLRNRRKYVKYLLKQKKEFLNGEKSRDILEFLEELLAIDPTYTKIPKLIENAKGRYLSSQNLQAREYIFQGLENTKILYQKGKYDQAIRAATELLQIDKNNQKGKTLLAKSIRHQEKIMTDEISTQIKSSFAQFKTQILKTPTAFIRL